MQNLDLPLPSAEDSPTDAPAHPADDPRAWEESYLPRQLFQDQVITRGASPADLRRRNRRAILQLLYPRNIFSRAELAKVTGLSKAAVSEVVAELIDDDLVKELGVQNSEGRGKPAIGIGFNAAGRQIITVDLSQPQLMIGTVQDLVGRVLVRIDRQVSASRLPLGDVQALAATLLARASAPVLGLAVATPGAVTPSGTVLYAPNLGWNRVDVAHDLQSSLQLPVTVINDADAAALGERQFGTGRADLLFIQLARGLGAGVLLADHLVVGQGYTAGEIGHVVVDPSGPACRCGKHGCLETLVSLTAIEAQLSPSSQTTAHPAPPLREVLAQAGHTLATHLIFPIATNSICDVVVSRVKDYDLQPLLQAMEEVFRSRLGTEQSHQITVRQSSLGPELVSLGAAVATLRKSWAENL